MKPYLHSKSSAHKFGGSPDDYSDIHNFMDSSKQCVADVRHRAILHSSFGCFIVEQMFGETRVNSAGKTYSTRDVAEQHILEDLGFIPSMDKWFNTMQIETWMGGPVKTRREIKWND